MKSFSRRSLTANIESIEAEAQKADVNDLSDIRNQYRDIMGLVRMTDTSHFKIGILDRNDIHQEALYFLHVLWEKKPYAPENLTGDIEVDRVVLRNYCTKTVHFSIKKARDLFRGAIKLPKYTKDRKSEIDWFICDTFTNVFKEDTLFQLMEEPLDDYDNEQLHDFLDDMMLKVLTLQERDIVKRSFGMGEHLDKPVSNTVLAKLYNCSKDKISSIKSAAIEKLSMHEDAANAFLNSQ